MSGFLQDVRSLAPSIILKLYQRRLLDKNAEITVDEMIQAHMELSDRLGFLQYRIERLHDEQLMLERLIDKKDLYLMK